ncbi:hypothetical protein [Acinetobacter higginsii]|uniref:hypothetical protein n=1 Tax=Acinetobacter higginsii TaxID=70347 RepID=UPI001F4A994F|nr:hypothetical protein [Acinetobacter higginsii]MCH7380660.1 hypothetical protein [Acinetobacter higginsii]
MDTEWEKDHEAYVGALSTYKKAKQELQQAVGVQKDFDKTSWTASEAVADLRVNHDKYAVINRFEAAALEVVKAKEKL